MAGHHIHLPIPHRIHRAPEPHSSMTESVSQLRHAVVAVVLVVAAAAAAAVFAPDCAVGGKRGSDRPSLG